MEAGSRDKGPLQIAKILLPHIGLSVFILAYLLGGAAVFQRLERDEDWKVRAIPGPVPPVTRQWTHRRGWKRRGGK